MTSRLNRRDLIKTAVGTLAAGTVAVGSATSIAADRPVEPDFKIRNGRVRQSVMGWCFNPMPAEELARHCREIGLEAIEGIGAEHYPAVRKLGLKISLVSSHGFAHGPFNRDNHEFCLTKLRASIDLAVEHRATSCTSRCTCCSTWKKKSSRSQRVTASRSCHTSGRRS